VHRGATARDLDDLDWAMANVGDARGPTPPRYAG